MRAGMLRDRVAFQRLDTTPDAYGNPSGGTFTTFLTVAGQLIPERGRERVDAGRLESAAGATLEVRSSSDTRGVTPADRVLINGTTVYNIREIDNPDRRNRRLVMVLEKGVAT